MKETKTFLQAKERKEALSERNLGNFMRRRKALSPGKGKHFYDYL